MVATTLVGALFFLGMGAGVASAASCSKGTACLWTNSNFSAGWGVKYSVSANSGTVWNTPIYNSASSGWANGGTCAAIRFYDLNTSGADYRYDYKYFVLNSQTLVGGNYRDPYFKNGAGLNGNGSTGGYAGENWNDRIGSWKFTAC